LLPTFSRNTALASAPVLSQQRNDAFGGLEVASMK
jgi:hypothetical protein